MRDRQSECYRLDQGWGAKSKKNGRSGEAFGRVETLDAHARSATIRLEDNLSS